MNCPYCRKQIEAWTGLQEALKFNKHLQRCKKNPNNFVVRDGSKTLIVPLENLGLKDALEIRAQSGQ